eukprot:scaffold3.g6374.t1
MPSRSNGLVSAHVGFGALLLVLSGTLGSLLGKLLYGLKVPTRDGGTACFRKPWASTLFMFVGMAALVPIAPVIHRAEAYLRRHAAEGRRRAAAAAAPPTLLQRVSVGVSETGSGVSGATTPGNATPLEGYVTPGEDATMPPSGSGGVLGGKEPAPAGPSLKQIALVLIPTSCDLVATILQSVGLLSVTASVYQMMRGSEVLFAAALSMLFLHRRLNLWHASGIALCVLGIFLVGLASVWSGSSGAALDVPAARMVLGMVLIVASEAIQAGQVVTEDYFMSSSLQMEPLMVVGVEGLLGCGLMLLVVLPLVQALPGAEGEGVHEDSRETLFMLAHSRQLRLVTLVFVVGLAVYNLAGAPLRCNSRMLVTDSLGAVTRTVLETMRTLFVWLLDLLLYYVQPSAKGAAAWGEPWTRWSWLEAAGFAVLVAGTLVYAHGDLVLEKQLRAKARWARSASVRHARRRLALPPPALSPSPPGPQLRESLTSLLEHRHERQPMRATRIAGPARIRTAFQQVLALTRLDREIRRRHQAAAAALDSPGDEGRQPLIHPRWGSYSRNLQEGAGHTPPCPGSPPRPMGGAAHVVAGGAGAGAGAGGVGASPSRYATLPGGSPGQPLLSASP